MRVSTKEDLYGFLDSIEQSIKSKYMIEYLNDIFIDYYNDFLKLNQYERDEVIKYLSGEYLKEHPDHAIILRLLPDLKDSRHFKGFLDSLDDLYDDMTTDKVEYSFDTDEDVMTIITESTFSMLSELEDNVTKKFMELMRNFVVDYDFIFESWDIIDYILDGSRDEVVDVVYNVIDLFNDHSSDHYEYGENETGKYFADIIKSIRSRLNHKSLQSLRHMSAEEIIVGFNLPIHLERDIKRDIIEEFNLNVTTDDKIAAIIIGLTMECLFRDLDFDQSYDDHSILSLYDYMVNVYAPIEYTIFSDK